jgi:DNA-binding NarL/FixJ family response regulator
MTIEDVATVRVLVADDPAVIRDGLSALLGLMPGIEVVGTAVDGDEAVSQALDLLPDVVLMDLRMPNCTGVEATRRLAATEPRVGIVVLTTYHDNDSVLAALQAGARGFLTKDAGADEILEAVTVVSAGGAQLDSTVQRQMVDAIASGGDLGVAGASASGGQASQNRSATDLPAGLTPREVEVLTEIAEGLTNTEIADKFCLSDTTVKTHVNHLLAKTGMRNRAQLVRYAFRLGLAC